LIAGEIALFAVLQRRVSAPGIDETRLPETVTGAVPELSRQRHAMRRAEQAIREANGETALEALESVDFGTRPVETYRRYYLANANELVGRREEARTILSRLWEADPSFVRRADVAFHLADSFERHGDWSGAVRVLAVLARDETPAVGEAAYERARRNFVAAGDVTSFLSLARELAIRRAATPAGELARTDLGVLGVTLTKNERIERVGHLAREGDARSALEEIESLRASGTTLKLEQARAEALARLGKRDEADRIILALVGQNDVVDRSLLASSWNWWSAEARTIESRAWRSVRVRRRSGSTRVRVGGKWVTKPTYTTVTRRVKRSLGRADRRRLSAVNKILIDRGERLLGIGSEAPLEKEIRRSLARAESSPRRQERLEAHVSRLVDLDPAADEMLQLLWDEGWAAWRKRDLDTARERFGFIHRTYLLPNIRRQARYWYARCLEESGELGEATRHYAELRSAPYDDVYSLLSRSRTASESPPPPPTFVPFSERPDDWIAIAERDMPAELRLAWELSLLGLNHDARLEVRANTTDENRTWAYSILARIHRAENSPLLVGHTLRIAYPEIGTVDQDRVPAHFLKMYYPTRYHDVVEREASRNGLDAALVKGLILQESAYDPAARSGAGATGLMQLMAPTAREIAPRVGLSFETDLLSEPEFNVSIGTRYLTTLLTQFDGNPTLALASYNGGIGNVRRWLRRELKGRPPDEVFESIPFSETRSYVKRVVFYRSVYEKLSQSAPAR